MRTSREARDNCERQAELHEGLGVRGRQGSTEGWEWMTCSESAGWLLSYAFPWECPSDHCLCWLAQGALGCRGFLLTTPYGSGT